jgi:hypothetical protein
VRAGFVVWSRGWTELRREDLGPLWEHLVLDLLRAQTDARSVHFWRDKRQREVDFVVARGRGAVHAVECKVSPSMFDPTGLIAFRERHPGGRNLLLVPSVPVAYPRRFRGLEVTVAGPQHLAALTEG